MAKKKPAATGDAFLGILGGLASIVGTYDRFGLGGATAIAGLILIACALLSYLATRPTTKAFFGRLSNFWLSTPQSVTLTVGVLLLLGAGVGWLLGLVEARLWRGTFTAKNTSLRIAESNYAHDFFEKRSQADLQARKEHDKDQLQGWIRWMVEGADDVVPPDPDPAKDVKATQRRRLVYLQSVPFDAYYATIEMNLTVAPGVKIADAAVFLCANQAPDSWYKPKWRQLYHAIDGQRRSLSFSATDPNRGEMVAVFLQVSPDERAELPRPDQIVPGFEIGVLP